MPADVSGDLLMVDVWSECDEYLLRPGHPNFSLHAEGPPKKMIGTAESRARMMEQKYLLFEHRLMNSPLFHTSGEQVDDYQQLFMILQDWEIYSKHSQDAGLFMSTRIPPNLSFNLTKIESLMGNPGAKLTYGILTKPNELPYLYLESPNHGLQLAFPPNFECKRLLCPGAAVLCVGEVRDNILHIQQMDSSPFGLRRELQPNRFEFYSGVNIFGPRTYDLQDLRSEIEKEQQLHLDLKINQYLNAKRDLQNKVDQAALGQRFEEVTELRVRLESLGENFSEYVSSTDMNDQVVLVSDLHLDTFANLKALERVFETFETEGHLGFEDPLVGLYMNLDRKVKVVYLDEFLAENEDQINTYLVLEGGEVKDCLSYIGGTLTNREGERVIFEKDEAGQVVGFKFQTVFFDRCAHALRGMPMAYILMGDFCEKQETLTLLQYRQVFESLWRMMARFPKLNHPKYGAKIFLVPGPGDPRPSVFPIPSFPQSLLGEQIPENVVLCQNPVRFRFHSSEILVYRRNLLTELLENQAFPCEGDEKNRPYELVRAVLDQAHCVPRHDPHIVWDYDFGLRLFPQPDVLILGDPSDDFVRRYGNTNFCNVSAFFRSEKPFFIFHPILGDFERMEVPA